MEFALGLIFLVWFEMWKQVWYVFLIPFFISCAFALGRKKWQPLVWGLIASWWLSWIAFWFVMIASGGFRG